MWELKRDFVMAVVSRAIRYIRECPLRELLLYESANDSLSLLGLVSPTSWTDRSFELNLLLLVFTQAFHKISIQTSINNTENMPQVTRSNNSAISIDNDASDL